MEIREDHHEHDPTTALYQAEVAGSVPSFKILIQKDPLSFSTKFHSLTGAKLRCTVHTSALLGHLEFTKALLNHNSRLAQVRDSLRRPPLLLASAEGHKDTVQALLKFYPDACLFRDQDGRIPLHYAAMRGHTEVLAELMRAKPESVSLRVLDRGGTVFHLCVIYNQIECLKLLVEEVGDNGDFLNARAGSDGGMTILELAVMLRQIQTIRYLLSLPVVRAEATVGNEKVMQLVLPNRVSTTTSIYINGTLTLFWLPLLALVVLYHTARFLIWLVKKLVRIVYPKPKRSRNSKSSSPQRAVHSQEIGSCV
ncbi:hypothetical protein M0R45_001743 [Rubus argutus]|uniref:Uncharacterized protein n=1 Tax=Rubus argutus TaxID=59490 RepID=A0AAW1VJE6_RUBAR